MGLRQTLRSIARRSVWTARRSDLEARADLVELGAGAVLDRAVDLGDTVVVPGRVVLTLPMEDLLRFPPGRTRDALVRRVQSVVRDRIQERICGRAGPEADRPGPASIVLVVGGDGPEVRLVPGSEREADALFCGQARTVIAYRGWPRREEIR